MAAARLEASLLKLVQKYLRRIDDKSFKTYEVEYPWLIYTFKRSDLNAILFGGKIEMTCAFCGGTNTLRFARRQAMFPKHYNPTGRSNPMREAFIVMHMHRNEPTWDKTRWQYPLMNLVNVERRGARDEGQVH
jgi:hypothetical protein